MPCVLGVLIKAFPCLKKPINFLSVVVSVNEDTDKCSLILNKIYILLILNNPHLSVSLLCNGRNFFGYRSDFGNVS